MDRETDRDTDREDAPEDRSGEAEATQAVQRLLELVCTLDLVAELKRRHRAVLVVMERDTPGEPEYQESHVSYSGGVNTAMGLAMRARIVLGRTIALGSAGPEDDEPEDTEGDEE